MSKWQVSAVFLWAIVLVDGQLLAQFQGISAGGGDNFGTQGGRNIGGANGGFGSGNTSGEIQVFGMSAEGTRFDRDTRQPGQFVGADSAENIGFVGVLGGNTINSQTSTGSRASGGLSSYGTGSQSSRSGTTFGTNRRTTGTQGFGGTGALGNLGRSGSFGGGTSGGGAFGNNFGGTFGGQRNAGLGGGVGGLGGLGGQATALTTGLGGTGRTNQLGTAGRTMGVGGRNTTSTGFGATAANFGMTGTTSRTPINFQTHLNVRFERPPTLATNLPATNLQRRLNASDRLRKMGSINVTVQDRTARLTGTVSSNRDRELARGLALLEPGISSVEDELVVAQAEEMPAPPGPSVSTVRGL